ncbi:MAG: SIMPL domain-containing protein [Balneolaceae bacterium]
MILRTRLITSLLLVFTFFATDYLHAQEPSTISISATAEVLVPVDEHVMRINITEREQTAPGAFRLHKEREAFLTSLLIQLDISEKNIQYQPVQIRPVTQRNDPTYIVTSQQVTVKLSSMEMMEQIQIDLVENGFTNFSGHFGSTKTDEAGEQALRNAMKQARAEADIIAEEVGAKVSGVQGVHYGSPTVRPASLSLRGASQLQSSDSVSLSEFAQQIPVQRTVQVVFYIQ